jgi:hypothetical protein
MSRELLAMAKVLRWLRVLLFMTLIGLATLARTDAVRCPSDAGVACVPRIEGAIGPQPLSSPFFADHRGSLARGLAGTLGGTLEDLNPLSLYLQRGADPNSHRTLLLTDYGGLKLPPRIKSSDWLLRLLRIFVLSSEHKASKY